MDGGPSAESMSIARTHHQVIRAANLGNEGGLRKLCGRQVEAPIGRLLHSVEQKMAAARSRIFDYISEGIAVLVIGGKKI